LNTFECFFRGGAIGYIETIEMHKDKKTYDFMPYRSWHHLEIVKALKIDKVQDVIMKDGNREIEMQVTDLKPAKITIEPKKAI